MSDSNEARLATFNVVKRFAPDESSSVELVWDNINLEDNREDGPGQFLSEAAMNTMFAAIIAPIALDIAKHLAKKGADALVALARSHLEKYRGKHRVLETESSINMVAEAIVDSFKTPQGT